MTSKVTHQLMLLARARDDLQGVIWEAEKAGTDGTDQD